MKKITKRILRAIIIAASVSLLSVIFINVFKPIRQKSVSDSYKEYVSRLNFQADSPSTERIVCIDSNEDALLWRLKMINCARESIVLTTFDLRADEAGIDVMSALYDAAERGVRIRILIDGIYYPIFLRGNDTFYTLCEHENVDARLYNPISLVNILDVNYRMHDKYLMIDDRMYLLGGRNTSDIFLGRLHEGSNIDRELLVYNTKDGKGDSFSQLEDYFLGIWDTAFSEPVKSGQSKSSAEKGLAELKQRYRTLSARHKDLSDLTLNAENSFEANKITLLANEIHTGNKEPRMLFAIEHLSKGAKEVIIQSPYVICNVEMYRTLSNVEKGSKLRLFINSAELGSNPWGCTDYMNQKERILETGADVYEVMNKYPVHTKTVLIGDRLSVVGSYNFDMRSTYINTELMLVVDSKELNSYMRDSLRQYEDMAIEVMSDGTETAGELYREKEMSLGKKFVYGLLRQIIMPFRYLL